VISASLQACGVLFPLAISTSTCRSSVTICSGLYFLIGIPASLQSEFSLTPAGTKNPGQVNIKPQNILIGYEKDGLRARVSDFGLAKSVNPLTLMASARGTRCFKSPEAFDDFNSDSCAGDVWAIGTTFYLLLTDRLPFDLPEELSGVTSKSFAHSLIAPSRLNALTDPRLDQLVLKCLAINPGDRYATARALLADLESWAPRLSSDTKTSSNSANKLETSKEILGSHSPLNEGSARRIAVQAIKMSQEVDRLNEAADLMEEAMNRYPALRSEYQGRVKLWRRGIVM